MTRAQALCDQCNEWSRHTQTNRLSNRVLGVLQDRQGTTDLAGSLRFNDAGLLVGQTRPVDDVGQFQRSQRASGPTK